MQKKQLKVIASVASDSKDEMYIPDGPKHVKKHLGKKERHFDTPSLRGSITAPLGMSWHIHVHKQVIAFFQKQNQHNTLFPRFLWSSSMRSAGERPRRQGPADAN